MAIDSVNSNYYQNPNSDKADSQTFKADAKSQAPGPQPELSPVEDKVTISSGDDAFLSATLGRILSSISSMSSQELGQIHQLNPATVVSLLAD